MLSVLVTVMGKIMAKLVQDWFRVNWEYENTIWKCTSKHILLHSLPVFPDMSPLRELCRERSQSRPAGCWRMPGDTITSPRRDGLPFSSCVNGSLQVIPRGLASRSGLRVGDRILEVNSIDLRHATHQEAVNALLSNAQELTMVVRRDPPPPGMQVGSK